MSAETWWEERERELDAAVAAARYDEEGDEAARRRDRDENRSCLLRPRGPGPDLGPIGDGLAWHRIRAELAASRQEERSDA